MGFSFCLLALCSPILSQLPDQPEKPLAPRDTAIILPYYQEIADIEHADGAFADLGKTRTLTISHMSSETRKVPSVKGDETECARQSGMARWVLDRSW